MLMLASVLVTILLVLFVLVSLLLSGVILIQKPRGGGLSGAFGGAGGAQSAFGSRTGDFLTWFTVACFTAFILLAIGLTWSIPSPNSPLEKESVDSTTPPSATQPAPLPDDTAEVPESPLPPTTAPAESDTSHTAPQSPLVPETAP